MKRQIKFRGKRVDTGEMVFGDLIHGQGSKSGRMYILPQTHIYPPGCNDLDGWEVVPDTVGQFTGLLDKNGKEIYEGDIAECCTDVCKVVYSSHYAGFGLDKAGWTFLHFFGEAFSNDDCVIIGSIHDNPELLKGGKE